MMKNYTKILLVTYILFASSTANAEEIAVIVNPQFDTTSINEKQVAQIFLGKSNTMTPYDQPESSAIRERFYVSAQR